MVSFYSVGDLRRQLNVKYGTNGTFTQILDRKICKMKIIEIFCIFDLSENPIIFSISGNTNTSNIHTNVNEILKPGRI